MDFVCLCIYRLGHHLVVRRHSLSRAFAVDGPAAWNSLSDDLHDLALSTDSLIQTSA